MAKPGARLAKCKTCDQLRNEVKRLVKGQLAAERKGNWKRARSLEDKVYRREQALAIRARTVRKPKRCCKG